MIRTPINILEPPAPYVTASLEEDAVLVNEAAQELSTVDTELHHIRHMQDIANTFDDIIKYSPAIDRAEPIDLLMVKAAAQLAVAGSDVEVHEIVPSIERYRGRTINMESFRSFLSGVWRSIVEALKRVWAATTAFLSAVIGTVPRMRFFLNRMISKLEATDRQSAWPESVTVGVELYALSVKDKLPKNVNEILERVDVLSEHVEFYLGEYLDTAKMVYNDLALGLEHYDEDNPESALNALSDDAIALANRNTPLTLSKKAVADPRFSSTNYVQLPPLPGDRSIFIRRAAIPSGAEPLVRAEAIQLNVPTIQDTRHYRKAVEYQENTLKTPDAASLVKLCNACLVMCDYVVRYNDALVAIAKDRDRMLVASKDLVDRADDQTSALGRSAKDVNYYRAAIRFNAFVTAAVAQPCSHLASTVMRVNRAVLAIGKRVLVEIKAVEQDRVEPA